jgi:NADH:ubiquinone oxidoreductase subunit 3 (subunit A)
MNLAAIVIIAILAAVIVVMAMVTATALRRSRSAQPDLTPQLLDLKTRSPS